jgi:hypothetical protein
MRHYQLKDEDRLMNTDNEVLYHCFERLAECDRDIAPLVYRKFTLNMPSANQHIDYLDSRMRGRMLDQVYRLLLDDVDEDYLRFETGMHKGYGADEQLYRGLLTAVKDSVSEALQDGWTSAEDAAWDRTIEQIVSNIARLEAG